VFKMLNALSRATAGVEHGSTLASSVVAEDDAGRGGTPAGVEHATTLLASVERCSRPDMPSKKSVDSPPRCLPAWSGVQDAERVEPRNGWC